MYPVVRDSIQYDEETLPPALVKLDVQQRKIEEKIPKQVQHK